MKKTLTSLILLLSCVIGYSKAVSEQDAKVVGFNYLHQKSSLAPEQMDDLKLVYKSGSSPVYFYIFSSDKSFVMVSADDAAIPVIGYSFESPFKTDHIPDNITGYFANYSNEINYIVANKIAPTEEIKTNWYNLANNIKAPGSASKTTVVTPLMHTTWDQSPYYNAMCPYDASAGALSVVGCVATATGQVMKFWGWPTTGTGFHSYSSSSFGTLSANYGSTTYNWSAMPNNVTAANASVATLLYHVGVGVEMNYSAASSGAYVISSTSPITNCAEYALRTYFGYDGSMHGETRAGHSDATWISMLEADLTAGRPIVYDGHGSGGGHCFVLDGFDASDNFHVNWGWSGYCDGYFAINAMNPSGTGTGGGSGGYNSGQEAILGVKPPTGGGGGGGGSAAVDTIALYDYVTPSASTINYYAGFNITTNVGNFSVTSFTGDFCAAAFDYTTGTFITFIDSVMSVTVPAGYTSGTLTFSTAGLLSMLPGNYQIGIFYRPSGGGWHAVWNYSPYTNFVPMTVVNHNYMELYAAMSPSPTTFIRGSAASVTTNIVNGASSTSFSGSYDVSLYNLDGSFNSTIQTMSGMTLAAGYYYTTPLTFSTSAITAAPGTYLLATTFNDGTGWYLAGADYHTNPIYITVADPAPVPDIYEVNNTAATAYNLPLTFSGTTASTSTPGSNFHLVTDQDYYKITLASGYNYTIQARVNDNVSKDDGGTYTVDATWTYSTDNGTSWSPVWNDVMTGNITIGGGTGGTVIFHVSPGFAGDLGNYLFKIVNVTRGPVTAVNDVNLSLASIYPNPASDVIHVDLQQTNINATSVVLTDVQGKTVYNSSLSNLTSFTIPVNNLADGLYFIEIATEGGVIRKKITLTK